LKKEIDYEVILREDDPKMNGTKYNIPLDMHSQDREMDIFLIMNGDRKSTRKICLNNYEIKRPSSAGQTSTSNQTTQDQSITRIFKFKTEDIGKIQSIKISIDEENNPSYWIIIDFIKIKIPSKSEAYKFPVERLLGEFVQDGKCDLDLQVWKHPQNDNHSGNKVML
jgi:hypothetical protein